MGLKDILFGSAPGVTSKTQDLLTPQQLDALQGLIPQLQAGVLGNGYQGASLASLEQLSQQSLTGAGAAADERLNKIISGQETSTEEFNKFFDVGVQNPALRDFQEQVLPSIGRSYGGSNFFGSERSRADDLARRNLLESLTQERARGALAERTQGRQDAISAIGALSNERQSKVSAAEATARERAARVALLLEALGLRTKENTNIASGGSTGLLQGFLSGAGEAYGKSLGGP